MKKRIDNRSTLDMRPISFEINPQKFSDGSVIISTGDTKVLCSASIEEKIPKFLEGTGKGWITAEYAMLPGSSNPRSPRENRNRGRSQEISRLIGRSLRSAIELKHIGERSISIDCDVLQADGGTRTASITGGYVALHFALLKLIDTGIVSKDIILTNVAATSIGIFNDQILVDLCYEEDSKADADFNIVMAADQTIVEVQGGAEAKRFSRNMVNTVLDASELAIKNLFKIQDSIISNYKTR